MIDFNKDYARKVSKAKFVKTHEAWKDKTDLGAEWEKLQVKEQPAASESEEATLTEEELTELQTKLGKKPTKADIAEAIKAKIAAGL